MSLHRVNWPGWQTVRVVGSGRAGAVYEIQRDDRGHTERAAMKVVAIPQNNAQLKNLKQQGLEQDSLALQYKGWLDNALGAYSVMLELKGHPNVVYCDDVRCVPCADGVGWDLCIKMELTTPVAKLFPQGTEDAQVIRLGIDVSRALALCAQRGLVHEAVRPDNVFVGPDGSFKLGDFGVAKAFGRPCGGDLTCMPPEIYWGMEYDCRTDVYALGILLYCMLNDGCLPLVSPGASAELVEDACVRRLSGEDFPPPKNGSPELQRVVMRACAYETAKRYETAELLLCALEQLAGEAKVRQNKIKRPGPVANRKEISVPEKKNKGSRVPVLISVAVLLLAAVGFFTIHIWTGPVCSAERHCRLCGKTAGRTANHNWLPADCDTPRTCKECGETNGGALGHQWLAATKTDPATCSVCAATEGEKKMPVLWLAGFLSNGWYGKYTCDCEGQRVTLSFSEDPLFASAVASITSAEGISMDRGSFNIEWDKDVLHITPADGLELGVYDIEFYNGVDAAALISLCYGYESDPYLRSSDHFWVYKTWKNAAHGWYLSVDNERVTAVKSATRATEFDSCREMFSLEIDTSGGKAYPVVGDPVEFDTAIYVHKEKGNLIVFVYMGWYLACDSKGTVYMTQELNEDCFWLAG